MLSFLVSFVRPRLQSFARRMADRLGLSGIVRRAAEFRIRHEYLLAHARMRLLCTRWAVPLRLVLILAGSTLVCDVIMLGKHVPFLGWLVIAAATWRLRRRGWRSSGSHGTATVSSLADLERGGLLCHRGLVLGKLGFVPGPSRVQAVRALLNPLVRSEPACRHFVAAFFGPRWLQGDYIRINDFVHLATFAPAGAGKSVSVLLPNLLSYAGNCVVVDPKYNAAEKG